MTPQPVNSLAQDTGVHLWTCHPARKRIDQKTGRVATMLAKFENLSLVALAVAAISLPGTAQAGTGSATGTATMAVVSQCSVSGATINLGTYVATNTWYTLANRTGINFSGSYTSGTSGQEYLNYGSVTCDTGTPYTLSIAGSGTGGTLKLTVNSQVAAFQPAVKRLGGAVVADSDAAFPGVGNIMTTRPLSGTGNGTAQSIAGNVLLTNSSAGFGSTVTLTAPFSQIGVYTDTLTYTLTF